MRTGRRTLSLLAAAFLAVFVLPGVAGASPPSHEVGDPELLTEGLKGGSGSYLSLYDDAEKEHALISAEASATVLSLNDSEMRADIGTPDDSPSGIFIGKDDKNFVSLRFDKLGGFVKVANGNGDG